MINFTRTLFLAPHTDDIELGCGGTLAKVLEQGSEVYAAAFSTADESLPQGLPPGTLREEFLRAMKTLKVPENNVFVYSYPVRRFSYYRQEILEELIDLRHKVSPELVFIPSGYDLHQDHQVLHREAQRAFKDVSILAYELAWNHMAFSTQVFITLKKHHVNAKWAALQEYHTQMQLSRPYFTRDFIEGLARVRGTQVKSEWAEAFEVLRIKW